MGGRRWVVFCIVLALGAGSRAQKIDEQDRAEAREMLRMVADDVRKHYYDPKSLQEFESRVSDADARIKTVDVLGQAFAMIGWALDGLHDSHTYFFPPGRVHLLQYGWRMKMIGARCYITNVRPGSDAEKKGIKPGDQLLSINGLPLIPKDFPKVEYIIKVLAPQADLKLKLRDSAGQERQLQVSAKIREVPQVIDLSDPGVFYRRILRDIWNMDRDAVIAKCIEEGAPLVICKLREFELDNPEVRKLIGTAKKHQGLILDLRDNPGGAVSVLDQILGGFFDHEIKVADRIGRNPTKPMTVKPEKDPFTGRLIVLIDSNSASASEIFARLIQLEKRGTVLGDHSAGLVMQGQIFSHKLGVGTVVYFAAMITDANVIMSDGQSLEGKGVTPDQLVLPTPADLSRGDDPVLARAAALLGVPMTPAEAGKLFPYEWPH